jgi:hypothetical protein
MKRLICILLPLVIGVLLFSSCDIGGFQDLAEMIDPTTPIGENSYSYMRVTTNVDGNNVTESITYNEPDSDGNGEFVLTVVVDDADDADSANWKVDVFMIRTTYNLSGTDITHTPYFAYHNTYSVGLGNATQSDDPSDFDQIIVSTYLSYVTGTKYFSDSVPGMLTYDSNDYTSFTTLYDNIMSEPPEERAKQFMRMYEHTIITSQTKIEGFGGMGMIHYLGRTVAFKGIRVGTFELTSEGTFSNTTDFNYKGYSDYQGLTIHGQQRSQSGTSGDGNMSGTVTFTLEAGATYTGSVTYDTIVLKDTLPKGGAYKIKFDGIDDQGTGVDPLQTTNPGSFDYTDIFIP